MHSKSPIWLYLTVFITGASIMVIELLGTRVVAPFYGSSLYVWTSIIAVTMMALAIGYFTGGYLADKTQGVGLSTIIAIAGLLTVIIPIVAASVLLLTDPLGLRLGSLTSTLILFTPSLTMLGMVSPFAVKLATTSISGVGVNTGTVYAISTVGSVIGTLLLGFFIFPRIGSREIFIAIGVLLLLLSLTVRLIERQAKINTRADLTLLLLLILGGVLSTATLNFKSQPQNEYIVRFARESLYGWVRVIDNPSQNFRVLTMDSSIIGAASLSSGENALSYQNIVEFLPRIKPETQRALLIGQGAGHMAMNLSAHGITTDTIEIDPAIARAAEDYFFYSPSGITIIGDARFEVRNLARLYDLIIVDVFTGGTEPFHLLTVEFLSQLRSKLHEEGLLVLNFVAFYEDGNNAALASVARTLSEVFNEQLVFISEPGIDFNDFIFLASQQPINSKLLLLTPSEVDWLNARQVNITNEGAQLLTDNLNPLESLQVKKSEFYRGVVTDLIGVEQLLQ